MAGNNDDNDLDDFIEPKPGESLKYGGGFMPQLTGNAAIKAAKAGRKIIEKGKP